MTTQERVVNLLAERFTLKTIREHRRTNKPVEWAADYSSNYNQYELAFETAKTLLGIAFNNPKLHKELFKEGRRRL